MLFQRSFAARQRIAPHLLEVSLDAYGWTGPWAKRRGYDSLVQMSCGIAEAGMHAGHKEANPHQPTPLPVQALDHATGYLMAASAVRALGMAARGQGLRNARLSLARTGDFLMQYPQNKDGHLSKQPNPEDFATSIEQTPWGRAHRLKAAIHIQGTPMVWQRGACELGSIEPMWM